MILRLSYYRFFIRLCCYPLPLFAFLVGAYIRFRSDQLGFSPFAYDRSFYVALLAFTSLAWILAVEHYRLCSIEEFFREYTGVHKAVAACMATCIFQLGFLFFYRGHDLSRIFFTATAIALFAGTVLIRTAFRLLLWSADRPRRPLSVLVVGADAYACHIARQLASVPFAPAEIVGHIRLPGQDVAVNDVPVFDLETLAEGMNLRVDDVVMALPADRLSTLSTLVRSLQVLCAPIHVVIDTGDIPLVRERLFQFGRLHLLDLRTAPAESLYYALSKRAFDMVFSICALILTAPLMLAIALLIKISSRGPVLFRQERVGLNGRPFVMYKLRTMKVEHASKSDTMWTVQDDPRRTLIGSFLRRTSLDELPQFFNVLKGNMSVVGPRPERPFFVNEFLKEISYYNTRHRMKVGITGWAQVNGWRGDTSIRKRIECDLYYLQNWSFWFDIRIICLTLWFGIFGRNAY
ncbi:MAG TPA: undecaprenyl-phosphate glucose phosphotransferase [Terriglobales bacterium]|jgi:Undecaprenyl-phosphate glucose phosphotransferase